jgi:hypothetical protein
MGEERMPKISFALIATLTSATWVAAETIDVKYYGKLDLTPFACTDVSRSAHRHHRGENAGL